MTDVGEIHALELPAAFPRKGELLMVEIPGAQPFLRRGDYEVRERSWTNPLPIRGISAEQLTEFWLSIVGAVGGQIASRERTLKRMDDAEARGDIASVQSGRVVAYAGKQEIKEIEAIAALLHKILAPAAPFLCDGSCGHVAAGATPRQAKRFLDSLDGEIARVRDVHAKTECSHPCFEDEREELAILGQWRSCWAKRIEASAADVEGTGPDSSTTEPGLPLGHGAVRETCGHHQPPELRERPECDQAHAISLEDFGELLRQNPELQAEALARRHGLGRRRATTHFLPCDSPTGPRRVAENSGRRSAELFSRADRIKYTVILRPQPDRPRPHWC